MKSALVLEPEGDIVIDLTGVTEDTSTESEEAWISIKPKAEKCHRKGNFRTDLQP